MPSEFQTILMALQSDLNGIMLSSIAANQALSNILGLYNGAEYSYDKNERYTHKWTVALDSLANALESFQHNATRLEAYLNGER